MEERMAVGDGPMEGRKLVKASQWWGATGCGVLPLVTSGKCGFECDVGAEVEGTQTEGEAGVGERKRKRRWTEPVIGADRRTAVKLREEGRGSRAGKYSPATSYQRRYTHSHQVRRT
ncbi:hypothetical protein chiPu_0024985 [Chiloscyllium punctatum]|uniref:Uncharacterized protein n=1 Tax=Chiloscyllium punctatum TaxID=137246 RepID=A0A401TE32_CHIPU|nr:hypothetical protein [Chiloscyllium punctatum]